MTLTANVAVVAGIIFLGIEVQQNNELLRTQANLVLSQNLSSATELVATDERLGGLLTSGGSLAELCGYRAHGALLQVGWVDCSHLDARWLSFVVIARMARSYRWVGRHSQVCRALAR
jgi:hypothetical protein